MYAALYQLACMAYRMILRSLLLKAVDDPDEQWDDILLSIVDKIFNYDK